jgi:hypothetical protein
MDFNFKLNREVNMQRGDMKRPSDQFFIHANIDTDVIVAEEPEFADTEKPEEIYNIIERYLDLLK